MLNILSNNTIIIYTFYIVLGVLSVVGTHFFNVPNMAITELVITFIIGNFLGLHIPAPNQTVVSVVPPVTPLVTSEDKNG